MKKQLQLKDVDGEELEDAIEDIGRSFNIRFAENELVHLNTFGQFCDYITMKMGVAERDDCTTQQAFYRFRSALVTVTAADAKTIRPNDHLKTLLPREGRREYATQLQIALGFSLDVLRPPKWLSGFLWLLLLGSLIMLFIDWHIGVPGLVSSIVGFIVANVLGKELRYKNVGEVAQKMVQFHYWQSRRDKGTFNRKEIEAVLVAQFSSALGIEKSELSREARFRQ